MAADTTDTPPAAVGGPSPVRRALIAGAVIVVAALAAVLVTRERLPEPEATITLKEYVIAAPTTLSPGEHVFLVRNTGHAHHNLTVCPSTPDEPLRCDRGPEVFDMLRRPVDARDQSFYKDRMDMLVIGKRWDTLIRYDLEPGTYRFYCGILGHAQNGMQLAVTVE